MNINLEKLISTGSLRRLIKDRPKQILAGLLFILIIWFIASAILIRDEQNSGGVPLFAVKRGPLTISVTESGTINNREKVVLKSKVEGKTTILSLVAEGTHVKNGDLLIQLDASLLEEKKTQQQIATFNAEAAYIRARENLAVSRSQAESDIAKAKLVYQFSQVDLKKYVQGEYPQELRRANAEITVAKEELQRAEEKLEWSQRLHREGHITRTELQADELAAKRRQLDLKLARSKLKLLNEFAHDRKLKELKSNLEQAEKALDRIKRKAVADNVQAEAGLKAKESEFKRQQGKLEKINEQIAKCRITAPVGGMVVYATTGQFKWRGQTEPLQEGLEVREGQELIHLPITSSMMAEVKIHESSLMKVRQGLPVRIAVDALPRKLFSGRVGKIALLPDAVSAWLNPDLKVYSTEIYLDGDGGALRPGMTCSAEIIIEEYTDALYVPVQSVLRVKDRPVVYVAGYISVDHREVEVGLDNNRMIRIISGLSEGEKVLLAPPLAPSEAPLQEKRPEEHKAGSSGPTSPKEPPLKQKASGLQEEKNDAPEETASEPKKSRLKSEKEQTYYIIQKGDTLSR